VPRDPALPSAARVRGIRRKLAATYGVPIQPPHGDPLAELVLTVLSQSTNDRNRDVAYLMLREALPTWEAVRDAPVAEVEHAIRLGGLHRQKSRRIQEVLRACGDPLDLDWLADRPVREGQAFLCALPGVGRKTAACVLLFAFGLHDVPVDTHVGRVTARLGLLPERGTSERLHDLMLALTPRGAALELHVNLLRHGRRTCHAQRPACGSCILRRSCPSALPS
jgi:endonuclease III